jgi:H/ACA ribonucleoprotein complex subunit 2
VVLAGDVTPLDTYSHMPICCEEAEIPYCFIPSKLDLGHAMGSKKSACIVLIKTKDDYKDVYDKCVESVKALPSNMIFKK